MQYKKIILLVFLFSLIISQLSFSQTPEEKKILKTVQKYYNAGDYGKAIGLYEELVASHPENFNYQYELALIYYHELNKKDRSILYFNKAKEIMKNDSVPELYFLLAQAYQSQGEYEKAIETFHYYRDIDSNFLKVNVKRYVELCNYGIELLNNPNPALEVINIGHPINTKFNEYAAINVHRESGVIFTAKNVINMFEELIETIYVSDYNSGTYEKPVLISELDEYKNLVVDPEEHSSIVNISADGKKLYLYANSLLYSSDYVNGVWAVPVKLNEKINFNFSNIHCSFTADGKEIYFSSYDRKNENNVEIYYSMQKEDGTWTDAIEIGKPINTLKNDDSPEITANGDTLYFASNGHKGMGGYDIFMSVKTDTTWTKPVNLGTPINSPWDDIYYKYNPLTKKGFISSNRKGGMGEMDIYIIQGK